MRVFDLRLTGIEDLLDLLKHVGAVVRVNESTVGAFTQNLVCSSQASHRVVPSNEPSLPVLNEEDAADGV